MNLTKKQIIEANLEFFKVKSVDYNKEEPSYKPENIRRVSKILKELCQNSKEAKLLDIGCGTGFIIDLAYKFTKNITGVDISLEMLKQVKTKNGIDLIRSDTSHLPFRSNYFDVCTSYGFLHHLYDITPTLKEAYRCLKKNGILYTDIDPNYYYWQNASAFDENKVLNEVVRNEIIHVKDPTDGYKQKKLKSLAQVGKNTIVIAEYQKTFKGGFKEEKIVALLQKIGFKKIEYNYDWYLGEGYAIHNLPKNHATIIRNHLKSGLPITRSLFKYVRIKAVK